MWHALTGLWQKARATAGGNPVSVPLVGGGFAAIGLRPKELLNLLILSIIDETKKKEFAQTIHIVLLDELRDRIDLAEVKRYWQ